MNNVPERLGDRGFSAKWKYQLSPAQAAGVSKGLLSVEKMNENGHAEIFDGDMSFVVNKATGEVNHLRRQDGNFTLDLWIPPPDVA